MVKKSKKQHAKVYHIDRLLPYKGRNFPKWFVTEERDKQYMSKVNERHHLRVLKIV